MLFLKRVEVDVLFLKRVEVVVLCLKRLNVGESLAKRNIATVACGLRLLELRPVVHKTIATPINELSMWLL